MKFRISKKYYAWLTVICFAFFIFFFSSIPDLKSGLDPAVDIILRKIAHATEFGVLTYLIFLAFSNSKLNYKKALVFALLISLFYAVTDEFHQNFVPGREMAFLDFLVDATGGVLFFYLIWIINQKSQIAK